MLEPVMLQYHEEKILGNVLRVFHRTAALAGDGENRPPINPAKLGQRTTRRLLSTFGIRHGKDQAPAGGGKHTRFAGTILTNVHLHERLKLWLSFSFYTSANGSGVAAVISESGQRSHS